MFRNRLEGHALNRILFDIQVSWLSQITVSWWMDGRAFTGSAQMWQEIHSAEVEEATGKKTRSETPGGKDSLLNGSKGNSNGHWQLYLLATLVAYHSGRTMLSIHDLGNRTSTSLDVLQEKETRHN